MATGVVSNLDIWEILRALSKDVEVMPDPEGICGELQLQEIIVDRDARHIKECLDKSARIHKLIEIIAAKGEHAFLKFFHIYAKNGYGPAIDAMTRKMEQLMIVFQSNDDSSVRMRSQSPTIYGAVPHQPHNEDPVTYSNWPGRLRKRSSFSLLEKPSHSLRQRVDDLLERNKGLETEKAQLQEDNTKLKDIHSRFIKLKGQLEKKEQEISNMNEGHARAERDYQKKIFELTEQCQELQRKASAETKPDGMTNRVTAPMSVEEDPFEAKLNQKYTELKQLSEQKFEDSRARKIFLTRLIDAWNFHNRELCDDDATQEEVINSKWKWLSKYLLPLCEPIVDALSEEISSRFISLDILTCLSELKKAHPNIKHLLKPLLRETYRKLSESSYQTCIQLMRELPTQTQENAEYVFTASMGTLLYLAHYFDLQEYLLFIASGNKLSGVTGTLNSALDSILQRIKGKLASQQMKVNNYQRISDQLFQLMVPDKGARERCSIIQDLICIARKTNLTKFSKTLTEREAFITHSCSNHDFSKCRDCSGASRAELSFNWICLVSAVATDLQDDQDWILMTENIIERAVSDATEKSSWKCVNESIETLKQKYDSQRQSIQSSITSDLKNDAQEFWSLATATRRGRKRATFNFSHEQLKMIAMQLKEEIRESPEDSLIEISGVSVPDKNEDDASSDETIGKESELFLSPRSTVSSQPLGSRWKIVYLTDKSGKQQPVVYGLLKNRELLGSSSAGEGQVYGYTHANGQKIVVKEVGKDEMIPDVLIQWVDNWTTNGMPDYLEKHLVKIMGFLTINDDRNGIIMEPMRVSLNSIQRKAIKNQKLFPEFFLWQLATAMLPVLRFFAKKGYAHGHIQLSDLMLSENWVFKLGNMLSLKAFGESSKVAGRSQPDNIHYDPAGHGKNHLKFTKVSDVYALGLTILGLAIGQEPKDFVQPGIWNSSRVQELIASRNGNDTLSDGFIDFISLCLAPEDERLEPKYLQSVPWIENPKDDWASLEKTRAFVEQLFPERK